MSEQEQIEGLEPTDDDTPDGTRLPTNEDGELAEEEGDAGVDDSGDEPWYEDSDVAVYDEDEGA